LLQPSLAAAGKADSELRAPMDGKIVAVLAKAGETVGKGQRLVVMEAMKMQHELVCRGPATIDRVLIREGDQVAIRQLLVAMSPADAAA
jgi:geranyl-CoA carboxylase alpha subunit